MSVMKKGYFFVVLLSILFSVGVYHSYFFSGKIPFPANLLASFYAPWDSQTFSGWEHGIPNKPLGHDALRFFFPIKKNIVEIVHSGTIPLWNPYVFAGSPLIANMQSSFFYPTTLLYLLFPAIDAWSIGVVITPILSTLFMYSYLKRVGIRTDVAAISGFFWAYSGFFAVWNQENPAVTQSAIWLPFILFGIERFKTDKKVRFLGISIGGMLLSFLGGHLQFSVYIFIFSIVYMFFRLPPDKKYYYISSFAIFPLLLSAAQLVPAIEAFINSPRSFENSKFIFTIYLVPITHLINIVAPDWEGNPTSYNYFGDGSYYDQILYVGLVPTIFALLSFSVAKKGNLFKIYGFTILVTLLFSFKNSISTFLFNQDIPFFSSVIPSRIFYLTSFSLLVMAATSLNEAFNKKLKVTRKQLMLVLSIPFILLAGGWTYFLLNKSVGVLITKPEYPSAMMRNLLLPSIILGICVPVLYFVFQKTKLSYALLCCLCGLAVMHQYYFYTKNVYFSERTFVYPTHPLLSYLKENNDTTSRVVGLGKAAIKPNVASYFNIYSPEGLDPMLPKNYAEMAWNAYSMQSGKSINPVIEVSFGDLFNEETEITGTEPIFTFFNMMDVKYIITHEEDNYTFSGVKFKKLATIAPFTIWEFGSLSRAFLTTNYTIMGNDDKQISAELIKLEKDPMIKRDDVCSILDAKILQYSNNNISLVTNADCQALLYLSDTYYPGWKAYVDEQETEILRANYAFRAVVVPSGNHTITMSYDPLSFKIGYYISLVSIVGLITGEAITYVKKIRT